MIYLGKLIMCCTILVLAVVQDIVKTKISNYLILIGMITGIIFSCYEYGIHGVCIWALRIIVPIVILGGLFFIRVLGAGDIKLLAVIGGYFGVKDVVWIIFFSFLAGALISLVKMMLNRNLLIRLRYLANYFNEMCLTGKIEKYIDFSNININSTVHFSICIAIGVVTYMIKNAIY